MRNYNKKRSKAEKLILLLFMVFVFFSLTSVIITDYKPDNLVLLDYYPITPEIISLRERIDAILEDYASFEYTIGLKIVSIDVPQIFYELDSDLALAPASNLKVITSAAGFELLGADFQWTTDFFVSPANNLYIRASGDPTWSDSYSRNRLNNITKSIADSLKSHGFSTINNIIVSPSGFNSAELGLGWRLENRLHAYSAKSSALAFNDNSVQIRISPTTAGSNARINLHPVNAGFKVINNVRTTTNRNSQGFNFSAEQDSNTVTVMGNIWVNSRPQYRTIAVPRPDLYSLDVLSGKLKEYGIRINGRIYHDTLLPRDISSNRYEKKFSLYSPPLYEVAEEINKRSNNFITNQLFLTIEDQNTWSVDSEKIIKQWLLSQNAVVDSLKMYDGSGLSYLNTTTADLLVDVLRIMSKSEWADEFKMSMAISGIDGTLKNALNDERLNNRVYAKTGFISGVRGLTGYIYTQENELLAFSFIVNKEGSRITNFNRIIERVLIELFEFKRDIYISGDTNADKSKRYTLHI